MYSMGLIRAYIIVTIDYQDTDSEQDSEIIVRRRPGPKPKNPVGVTTPGRGRPAKEVIPLKRRLHALAKLLLDYTVSYYVHLIVTCD